MPEMRFRVRWPDETVGSYYSPSLVIKEYFTPGRAYELAEFLSRSRTALHIASERVKQKYGFYCTSAESELRQIEQTALQFQSQSGAKVLIESFEE